VSAVGRAIQTEGPQSEPWEVIGVARDHKVRSVGESPRPYLHMPAEASRSIGLVVRTTMAAEDALPTLRQAIRALEPNVVFIDESTAAEVAAGTMVPTKAAALAAAAFGGLALLLAAIGLYGVIAYGVSRRTREFGVRMALGAERTQVMGLVMRQGARLAITGAVLGMLAAAAAAQLLDALLYGVSRVDPIAYAAAAGALLVVAGVANVIPALAATRVDPAAALRATG
jgi:predicted lysophospholipase L1 biosynthesis ABC-type transport system permease subunit